jgi:peptidoglycan-associated lipoprotein
MKKRWFVLFTVVLCALSVLFFFGCAKKATVSDSAEPVKQVAAQKEAAPQPTPVKAAAVDDAAAKAKGKALKADAELKEASQIGDIYFEFDKFKISESAKKTLQKYHAWLSAHPGYVIRIEGTCDERGTVEYNLALGERRSKAAMNYLSGLGTDKTKISIISFGKERPADPGHNEEAWSKNRRDHFVITAK